MTAPNLTQGEQAVLDAADAYVDASDRGEGERTLDPLWDRLMDAERHLSFRSR